MERFGLHSNRVLIGEELTEATVEISNGKIVSINVGELTEPDITIENVGNSVIMPGLIDCHVHINEPGRTDWEGFDTATKAAAAGGITTLIEMPLNSSPVTTTKAAFEKKITATKNKLHVNCGFWGGIVPENINELDELIESGVFGVKAFLTHSGIEDFPNVTEEDLRKGLPILKKHKVPLLVHAELNSPFNGQNLLDEFPTSYQAYLASRPKKWEDEAIKVLIELAREFDSPIHVVHLSSSNSIDALEDAKREGLPITVETCPHYLVFNAEDIPDEKTQFKCAPPIREKENNDKLWDALEDGLFSFIVSDHSPAPPNIKNFKSGNFATAWGGISGVTFNLPAIWKGAESRAIPIAKIAELLSSNVAEFLGLGARKGKIAIGYDADLVVWNPEESFEVDESMIHFRHKVTPYLGEKMKGKVERTYVSGHKVFDNGQFKNLSKGRVLKRK